MDRPSGPEGGVQRAMARLCLWRSLFSSILADNEGVKRFAHEALAVLDSPALAESGHAV